MKDIKDRNKNPGYSRFSQQLFLGQVKDKEFSAFHERLYRFPGFYIQRRSIRAYQRPIGAHILGDVAEVNQADVEKDEYYQPGDYIGKMGVEREYEKNCADAKEYKFFFVMPMDKYKGAIKMGNLIKSLYPEVIFS